MNKSELQSKHISELHALAAEAGVERYRMLTKTELVEALAGGEQPKAPAAAPAGGGEAKAPAAAASAPSEAPAGEAGARPKRKRRRRRWGRRRKGVGVNDLLLPASGRQALVYGADRATCTALLREVAAEISGASKGPDPIALLIDPSPEELADWKREAPQAEIVSAGKAQHADDAVAQARTRAAAGEDVIVLIDSLSRFAESFAGPDEARDLFDAGQAVSGNGSLTVVAALEQILR